MLHVVDGVGRVQQRGGPVEEIRNGDAVVTEPGVWHWHGAAPGTFMTHLAIQQTYAHGVDANWGDQVSNSDYLTNPASK